MDVLEGRARKTAAVFVGREEVDGVRIS